MKRVCAAIQTQKLDEISDAAREIATAPETLSFAGEEDDILSRQERLDEIYRWADDEVQNVIENLERNTRIPPLRDLDSAKQFVSTWDDSKFNRFSQSIALWLPHAETLGQSAATLRGAVSEAETNAEFRNSLKSSLQSADSALSSLDTDKLADASFQWESIRSAFPNRADAAVWSDYQRKLRQAIRKQVAPSSSSPPPVGAKRVSLGSATKTGPRRISLDSVLTIQHPSIPERTKKVELVFAKVHGHCYALDAKSGSVRWIIDMGHDAKWLPESFEQAKATWVHAVTVHNGREAIHVTDANGNPQWSIELPQGSSLSGPPLAAHRSLHLLLQSGELWTLDPVDGSTLAHLKLPEPCSSPMVVREDRQGVMLVGDQLALYLIQLNDSPIVEEVVFPEPNNNMVSARGLWIPPFAVVFQNELTETCRLKVYREQQGEYRLVQESSLQGRLWDSPAVVGADFLVVTDAVTESIQHVDVDKPIDPISPRFQRVTPTAYPRKPYFLSHPDAPFLSVRDATLTCYWIDSLAASKERKPIVRWEHQFPTSAHTAVQTATDRERQSHRGVSTSGQSSDHG